MDPHLLHIAVRWLHVVAMAMAFGGAALVFVLAAGARQAKVAPAALLQVAAVYEWAFWLAAGTLAMTGIGNLGAFGAGLPSPETGWGTTLVVKLSVVVLLVVLSLPRTLAVARLAAAAPSRVADVLRTLYGATSATFAVIVAIAVWLAHG
jgi:putative copper export protein